MAIRRIYVSPGDLVIVHVIDSHELPLNAAEWGKHKPHPFKFHFTVENDGVTLHDPGLDVGLVMGFEARRQMVPIAKEE